MGAVSAANERLDHLGIVAECVRRSAWQPDERENGEKGHDLEWVGFQQSSLVCGASVLCRTSRLHSWWGGESLPHTH
jgi:hypothetical protein